MDIFYHSMQSNQVLRLHFHHFMKEIHQQLKAHAGKADPLKLIAKKLSQQYKILCFDEFFVSDIGDAMLLGKLLQYLFEYKLTLVATSNFPADSLYKNGLQRDRFLPAIKSIMHHTQTINLNGPKDHRKRALQAKPIYFLHAPDSNHNHNLLDQFQLTAALHLSKSMQAQQAIPTGNYETILGRNINYIAKDNHKICFSFRELCEGPRSHLDYIELASRYQTILLFDLPPLSGQSFERIKARGTEDGSIGSGSVGEREVVLANMDDATRRFIALVDELYDRKRMLYLTSATPLDTLYLKGSLVFEFQRTHSRLIEMATEAYQNLSES